MQLNRLFGVGLLGWLLAAAPAAGAGDELRWQETLHITRLETSAVTREHDAGAHLLALWEMRGLAVFADEVAVMHSTGFTDHDPAGSSYTGYAHYRFADGSTKTARLHGRIVAELEGGSNRQEGAFTMLGGTGRFAAVIGQGRFTAVQYTPALNGGLLHVEVRARLMTNDR